jgi:uncharacterized protein YjiS (DUF1127 family)
MWLMHAQANALKQGRHSSQRSIQQKHKSMEMIMSMISSSAPPRAEILPAMLFRWIGSAAKRWATAYINWRVDQLAITRLRSMSDRELKDIGVSRAAIEFAVKGGSQSHARFIRYY